MIANCNRPDSLRLLNEVDIYIEELADDFEIRRRVTRQWSGAKSSGARERHRNEELVSEVPAYRHTRRDVGTCLLSYSRRDTFGAQRPLRQIR